ncbi:hypothetical protein [Pseudomonas psychrophila]|uniref:Uncharacterized protein n=1 Tax=Pseudomonas psychrophila TaxID=122355 RepID=A0A8I1KBJ1_9PSED|nr:hypothetical protein [Pseudomonas psychrophila]MBJ2259873.1 hypothetical protein [Pseudomonas psychrophila]
MTTINTDKIVISGVPAKYDASELQRRQKQYQAAYKKTSQSCDMVRGGHPKQFLQAVIDHAANGYSLTDYAVSLDPAAYSTLMRKPESMQEVDLTKINNDVRDTYKAELEASHEGYKQRLFAQLVQAEESKQAAKVQAAKDKVYDDLRRQAEACYAPLDFPEV